MEQTQRSAKIELQETVVQAVRPQSQSLICVGVDLGLVSSLVRKLTGELRPAIGFGPDHGSADVKSRYEEILRICKGHRPLGVPCIDTWTIEGGVPPAQVGGS